jgi:hypothetical protein
MFFVIVWGGLFAAPVPRQTAEQAAGGWLRRYPAPMEVSLSPKASQAKAVADVDGRALYYVIHLEPQGFVVLSADDEIEPVIAFSATGRFDSSEDSPLSALLGRDMQSRLEWISRPSADETQGAVRAARGNADALCKWQALLEAGTDIQAEGDGNIQAAGQSFVSDVRVPPLLQSKWGQGDAAGGYCYNYYTPNHYVTGCVATAMAQLMRYHQWPVAGIGVHSFRIYVDDAEQYWNTRGGNGSGGAYNWAQMPSDPEAGLTATQRQAIGALCYDAGLTVNTGYTSDGSGASTSTADLALVDTFGYANSIYGYVFATYVNAGLTAMMNPNLDAGMPVLLSISGPGVAHAVLADGYGYSGGTVYHHLNMGWTGLDDAWYQFPVELATLAFTTINGCIYNVYPSGTGEIISGRATSLAGAPLEGVTVTAYQGTTVIQQAVTNARGIYALKYLPSSQSYRLSAVKVGYVFADQIVSTGVSQDWRSASGNKWGIDFSATNASPPAAMDQVVDAHSPASVCIRLEAMDDHLPDPPGRMTFIITSLPGHGTLSEPNVGPIDGVPYVMAADANSVCYTPCPYFGGEDCFTFKANDGGTFPSGGDSNIATVTLNVDNHIYSEFGTDGTISTNTMINTTYYASRSQALYLKSDIGSARTMTDLAIHFTQKPPITLHKFAIRMQHTNKTEYNDVVADFLTSGWTLVYRADRTISQTGWTTFHFSTPFDYNGTQNLLIEFSFDNTTLSGNTGLYLFKDVGAVDRVITIVTPKASHSDPLTWDFWYNEGWYWGGGWLPGIKLIGIVPISPMAGDFDATCDVRLPDLAVLSGAWKSQQGQADYNPACDMSTPKDSKIDLFDLLVLADQWLQRYEP